MYMRTKIGKMIWLAAVGIIVVLGFIVVCTSCTSMPDGILVEPVDRAYRYYLNQRTEIDASAAIALLSYSSSMVSQSRVRSWEQLSTLLDEYYKYVLANERVSANYPTEPSAQSLQLYNTFIRSWCKNHRGRVAISNAPAKYTGDVNNLIFRIITNEYNR